MDNRIQSGVPSIVEYLRRAETAQQIPSTPSKTTLPVSSRMMTIQDASLPSSVSNGKLLSISKTIGDLAEIIRAQAREDASAEKNRGLTGTVRNGLAFADTVRQFVDLLRLDDRQMQSPRSSVLSGSEQSLGIADAVDALGSKAQGLLVNHLKDEAMAYAAQELGLNPSNASVGDLAEAAWSYLTGESVSGTATTTGSTVTQVLPKDGLAGLSATAQKVVGAAGAAYSVYNLFKNFGKRDPIGGATNGAIAGAYIGSQIVPGLGTLVGGAIGGVVGFVSGLFKSGKHKDQIARDRVRDVLKNIGLIDNNWSVPLADGSRYDIGKDGGFKLTNSDGTTTRRAYEIDFDNPLVGQVIGWVNPFVELLTNGNDKLRSDFVGYFVNAATSNATTLEEARQNVLTILGNLPLSLEQVLGGLDGLRQQGGITQSEFEAYLNGIKTLGEPVNGDATQPTEARQAA